MRNCCRCGQDFEDDCATLRHICHNCRKTRAVPKLKGVLELLGKPFSVRETQLIECVCAGMQNKEIAYSLHLAEGTIKVFMSTILRKAGVLNRTALAMWWTRK